MKECSDAKHDLKLDAECCRSCHIDAEDYGYRLMERTVNGDVYEVCCGVGVAIDAALAEPGKDKP